MEFLLVCDVTVATGPPSHTARDPLFTDAWKIPPLQNQSRWLCYHGDTLLKVHPGLLMQAEMRGEGNPPSAGEGI